MAKIYLAGPMKRQVILDREELVRFLIKLQDECDIHANSLATHFIEQHELEDTHKELTGNPDYAYVNVDQRKRAIYVGPHIESTCGKRFIRYGMTGWALKGACNWHFSADEWPQTSMVVLPENLHLS